MIITDPDEEDDKDVTTAGEWQGGYTPLEDTSIYAEPDPDTTPEERLARADAILAARAARLAREAAGVVDDGDEEDGYDDDEEDEEEDEDEE